MSSILTTLHISINDHGLVALCTDEDVERDVLIETLRALKEAAEASGEKQISGLSAEIELPEES